MHAGMPRKRLSRAGLHAPEQARRRSCWQWACTAGRSRCTACGRPQRARSRCASSPSPTGALSRRSRGLWPTCSGRLTTARSRCALCTLLRQTALCLPEVQLHKTEGKCGREAVLSPCLLACADCIWQVTVLLHTTALLRPLAEAEVGGLQGTAIHVRRHTGRCSSAPFGTCKPVSARIGRRWAGGAAAWACGPPRGAA